MKTVEEVKVEWHKLDVKMSELKKVFVDKVKRSALSHAEHELLNKQYFRLKADMDRLVELGKKMNMPTVG